MHSERYRWALVIALLTMLAAVRAGLPSERDPYWSARAGIETLQGVPLARPDNWSWSADGVWYPNSPAWNVVLGLGWQGLGFWGFFWVALFAMGVFFTLAVIAARAMGARAIPTFFAFAPLLLGASAALSARATIVVQSLVLGAALFAWWWAPRATRMSWALAAVIAGTVGFAFSFVGNWVHLSFMAMAAVVAVMWAIVWWLTEGMPRGRRVLLTVAGTVGLFLGCLLSPYGISLTLEHARIVSEICSGLIIEWTSVWGAAGIGDYRWIVVALVGVLAAVAVGAWCLQRLLRDRRDPGTRLAIPLAVVAVPAVLAGVGTVRFLVAGMLLMAPVAASALTVVVGKIHRRQTGDGWFARPKVREYSSGKFWTVVLTSLAVVLLPVVAVCASVGARPLEQDVVEAIPRGCTMFSDSSTAASALLTRHDVQVWSDGRADFYGRQHLIETNRIVMGVEPVPEEADCVMLPPERITEPRLAERLDESADWQLVDEAAGYRLWVRR